MQKLLRLSQCGLSATGHLDDDDDRGMAGATCAWLRSSCIVSKAWLIVNLSSSDLINSSCSRPGHIVLSTRPGKGRKLMDMFTCIGIHVYLCRQHIEGECQSCELLAT